MSWQRAVFFGGAVLVLSACGDSTAPTLSQVGGTLDARKAGSVQTPVVKGGKNDECAGVVIHTGIDGSLTPTCVILPPPSANW